MAILGEHSVRALPHVALTRGRDASQVYLTARRRRETDTSRSRWGFTWPVAAPALRPPRWRPLIAHDAAAA